MEETEFLEDIQYAYSYVLNAMIFKWTHDSDNYLNYHNTCEIHTKKINKSVLIKFEPVENGSEYWHDEAIVTIEPLENSDIEITTDVWFKVRPYLEQVENKFIDSVNGFIKKYGTWIKPLEKGTFNELLNIKIPIYLRNKKLFLKYKIIDFSRYRVCSWKPKELIEWTYTIPGFIRKAEEKIKNFKKQIDHEISTIKNYIKMYEKEIEVAFNQLHYIEVMEKLLKEKQNLENKKKELEQKIDYFKYPYRKEVSYTYDDEEIEINEGLKESTISLENAFPERNKLKIKLTFSGIKRTRDE
jgi:hypothetical protein